MKPGVDLFETCLLFTFWTHTCRCMHTYIHAEWGNTVMQSHILLICFSFTISCGNHCHLQGNSVPPVLQRREDPTEMATPVYIGCSQARSMKVSSETCFETQSYQVLRLKPCWCCSWRMFCRAQSANSLVCIQVDHRYFVSACSSISVEGITFQSYGCNFRTDQLLTYTPLLAVL